MSYLYSPETGGFYHTDLHRDIPSDAIAITDGQHNDFLAALAEGKAIIVDEKGKLTVTDGRPSGYHEWDGKAWSISAQAQAKQLAAAKQEKLAALNAAAQNHINTVSGADRLPDFEVRTWTLQALEAHAWHEDRNAPTPTLDTIAASRGIPAELLKQKAYEKAVKFEQLTAAVVGYRQALQTRIEQAGSLKEVQAVQFDFRLPEILKSTGKQENENAR